MNSVELATSETPYKPEEARRDRIASIDCLRGLVMVLMALDHVRSAVAPDLLVDDASRSSLAGFLTRWITHCCAPTFIFLAGVSASLYGANISNLKRTSVFLFTRGVWLVFVDVVILNPRFEFHHIGVGVIWAIGWSMIVLSALVWLPRPAILLFGTALVLGHNLLDSIHPDALGQFESFFRVLHVFGPAPVSAELEILVGYPLVPWIGVMALGYCWEPVFRCPEHDRWRRLALLGIFVTLIFLILRWTNVYGDLRPWMSLTPSWRTLLSFIACEKYPPSLCLLTMTLGPMFLLWALLVRNRVKEIPLVNTFGKVPFFFYLLHVFLVHGAVLVFNRVFSAAWVHRTDICSVYLGWVVLVATTWPLCVWFAQAKRRWHGAWWLGYL